MLAEEMVAGAGLEPTEAVKLAEYLRRNPLSLENSASSVAQAAGVSEGLVTRVFHAKNHRLRQTVPSTLPKFLLGPVALFDRATENVSLFVLVTSVAALIVGLIVGVALNLGNVGEAIAYLFLMGAAALHMTCYFRHGQARLVLRGTSVLGAVLTIWMVASNASDFRSNPERAATMFFLLILVSLMMAFLYLTMGMVVSVVGGYIKVRREESSVLRLDRQGLLERLFELDERLRDTVGSVTAERPLYRFELFRDFRDSPYIWALVLGTGLGALSSVLFALAGDLGDASAINVRSAVLMGVAVIVMFVATAAQILLSYSCRRVSQAILVALVFSISSTIPYYLPLPGRREVSMDIISLCFGFLIGMGNGLIGGLGAAIEERAARSRRLVGNDPETLLAEIVEVQRLLMPGTREITVMVVDAARSSLMKASADPFVAEWTFRAYQQFLEKITREFGGTVFSTAGDGATMQFNDATAALETAREIQRTIKHFNQKVSKLQMPFMLRIGIHMGQVRGMIEEVQFTEVIDVAAHVEAASPVGGIGLSAPVYAVASFPGIAPLGIEVDGFDLYAVPQGSLE